MSADPTFWNGVAEEYSRKPVELPDAFERKIEITQGLMAPDHTVLDIGCGTGSLALRLAPSAAQVVGLDVSSEMVRIARDKAQSTHNARFVLGPWDADAPFDPESFDGICAYSLLHLVDTRAALDLIFERLKPGGFLVSSTVCLGDTWVPYRPILAVMKWAGKAPVVHVISQAGLLEHIAAAGFVDVELHDVGAKETTTFLTARKPLSAPGAG